jgi:2-oxoglutarate ferredoxin oxidoreductase subunit alpha
VAEEIMEHEVYGDPDAETLIIAHGIVASAAKAAIQTLKEQGVAARLFRPITLRPFPEAALRAAAKKAKRIIVAESAINQLTRFVKESLYGQTKVRIEVHERPSIGIVPDEIVGVVMEKAKV